MDDDGNRSLGYEEFRKGIEESGVKVNDEGCRALFTAFDVDGSGSVCINEFLKAIRVNDQNSFRDYLLSKPMNFYAASTF